MCCVGPRTTQEFENSGARVAPQEGTLPRVRSIESLRALKTAVRAGAPADDAEPAIAMTVGMGTCGIAAGAREVLHAILTELELTGTVARVTTVGCAGECAREPLVQVSVPGTPTVTYGNVQPAAVPRLIRQHLVEGRPVREWMVIL